MSGGARLAGRLAVIPDEYLHLRILTECYQDVQKARIGMQNRVGSGTVYVAPISGVIEDLVHSEKILASAIGKALKAAAPDVHAWTKQVVGLGPPSVGQLLGLIGPPSFAYPHHWVGLGENRILVADEPYVRTLAQLWAYCGHGDPARKRRAGMDQSEALRLGNDRAKRVVHLIAEGCVKCRGAIKRAYSELDSPHEGGDGGAEVVASSERHAPRRRSPYRDVYDDARETYVDRDWTVAHQHAAALRLVGKTFLSDLYDVALASTKEAAA